MRKNRFKIIVLSVVFGAFIGAILTQIAIARADNGIVVNMSKAAQTACDAIHATPTVAGVYATIVAMTEAGYDQQQEIDVLVYAANVVCPDIQPLIRAAGNQPQQNSTQPAPAQTPVTTIPRGEQLA